MAPAGLIIVLWWERIFVSPDEVGVKIGHDQVVSRLGIPLCDRADLQRAGDTVQVGV